MLKKTEWTVGPNKLQFLPPDIFFVDANGPTTLPDMKEAMRILEEEVYPEVDIFFFLIRFVRSAAGLSPEVREYHFAVKPRFAVMMLIGGTPVMRAALTIASRAIRLWNKTATEMRMVKTLEEALALADEIRAKKAAEISR
jgi:hypothetical protein